MNEYQDEDYGLEEPEDEKTAIAEENWSELLTLRKARAESRPDDLYAWQRYAEALNLNKMYGEAIEAIEPFYRENHDLGFGIPEIIDALFGMGKTENEFDWIEKPEVVKLDFDTLDYCIETLRKQKRPIGMFKLYENLLSQGEYLSFHFREFHAFVAEKPDVFNIDGDLEHPLDIKISLI